MKLAAMAAHYGFSPMDVLTLDVTSVEFLVVQAAIQRADELRDEFDRSRANHIANAVAKLF